MNRRAFLSAGAVLLAGLTSWLRFHHGPRQLSGPLRNQPDTEVSEIHVHPSVQRDLDAALGSPEDQVWASVEDFEVDWATRVIQLEEDGHYGVIGSG